MAFTPERSAVVEIAADAADLEEEEAVIEVDGVV